MSRTCILKYLTNELTWIGMSLVMASLLFALIIICHWVFILPIFSVLMILVGNARMVFEHGFWLYGYVLHEDQITNKQWLKNIEHKIVDEDYVFFRNYEDYIKLKLAS